MNRKNAVRFPALILCLLLLCLPSAAETRQSVIAREGMEETIEETLYESPEGISFWYPSDTLTVSADGAGRITVSAPETGAAMTLMRMTEEEAAQYKDLLDESRTEEDGNRVQADVSSEYSDGAFEFVTVLASGAEYLKASGAYPAEAADGVGKMFRRVLDSVTLLSVTDMEFLKDLPGTWSEAYDGASMEMTFREDGTLTLSGRGAEQEAYTRSGTWQYTVVPEYTGELTLRFDTAENREALECVYAAYMESWTEGDTEITYLILNPPVRSSGVSPFEEVFGEDGVSVHREKGPNMRVVKCKEYVSLRASRSASSKRLARVPLGAMVLAYPEMGEENGFIYCVYQGKEGYILSEYLESVQ